MTKPHRYGYREPVPLFNLIVGAVLLAVAGYVLEEDGLKDFTAGAIITVAVMVLAMPLIA